MIFWLILLTLLVFFGFVLWFGAPYVPTLKPQIKAALDLSELKPGQTMIDLGCGDGRVVLAAAKQGIKVVGYEINPVLYWIARYRTRKYPKLVTIHLQDFWKADWPKADAIFTFLLPRYMVKLDKKIARYQARPIKLVSSAFLVPDRVAKTHRNGVWLYLYE